MTDQRTRKHAYRILAELLSEKLRLIDGGTPDAVIVELTRIHEVLKAAGIEDELLAFDQMVKNKNGGSP